MSSTRGFLVLGMAWLAGCAAPGPPVPTPAPVPDDELIASTPDAARPSPDANPPVRAELPPAPPPVTIAILFSGSTDAQAAIAAAIGDGLSHSTDTVLSLDIDAIEAADLGDCGADGTAMVVAAIGPDALNLAMQRFDGADIVFSYVLEPGLPPGADSNVYGVESMPRPDIQFAAWSRIDPGLERIALITSAAFASVVPGASLAATAIGAELVHRVSTSDRESMYIFRRLAPSIDGLWLAPDSEILSTAIIDEILALAAEFNIGVLVFSERLLDRGGLISVGASAEQIAGAMIDAIDEIRAGRAADLPTEIALTEGDVRVNARVAARLGLPPAIPAQWIFDARQ